MISQEKINELKDYIERIGQEDLSRLRKVFLFFDKVIEIDNDGFTEYNFEEEYKKEIHILVYYDVLDQYYDDEEDLTTYSVEASPLQMQLIKEMIDDNLDEIYSIF